MFDADGVRWVVVYITEAHAVDEWPISSARFTPDGEPVSVEQPTTTETRMELAKRFAEEYKPSAALKLYVDPLPGDLFQKTYAAWPIRFFVTLGTKLRTVAMPNYTTYDPLDMRRAIESAVAEVKAAAATRADGGADGTSATAEA